MQMKGKVNINDDAGLEKEADVMGEKALQDNRLLAITQRKLQDGENSSSLQQYLIQRKENNLGIEDNLRTENKNYSLDQISIHNNSSQTAQLKTPIIQKAKAKNGKTKVKKAHTPKIDLKKQTMTVRNKKDKYTSGLINGLSRATGVESGPRAEAKKIKKFLGGSWIGGHMVNDQLGGNGSFKNIVPITSSMNGLHKSVENQANNLLSAGHGTQIEYKMKILKRATVKNAVKTVKNLPIEFKQTLHVYPVGSPIYTIDGYILEETNPGDGKIQP